MFRQTRWRLVLWNSLVVASILAVFSISIYSYLNFQLIASVDKTMRQQLQPVINSVEQGHRPPIIAGAVKSRSKAGNAMPDRPRLSPLNSQPLGVLVWQLNGSLAFPAPHYLTNAEVRQLQTLARPHPPVTVVIQQQRIRVAMIPIMVVSNGNPLLVMGFRNINGVLETLQELRFLTITGLLIGVGVSFVMGMILANRALVPIRKAWDKQVQFVADASHELRTPLAAIQVNAETLLGQTVSLSDSQARAAHGIFAESRRLGRLLDHLLSLARSDANTAQLALQTTDLTALTRDIAEQFAPLCESVGMEFVVHTDEEIAANIDPERMRQVLFNLLDNARKFTPEDGTITLSLSAGRRAVEWRVTDTGSGINAIDIPRIFDRFYQGHASHTTKSGSGLGLAIVKWIVEAHDGTVQVRSQPGVGSEFTVTIPFTHESPHRFDVIPHQQQQRL